MSERADILCAEGTLCGEHAVPCVTRDTNKSGCGTNRGFNASCPLDSPPFGSFGRWTRRERVQQYPPTTRFSVFFEIESDNSFFLLSSVPRHPSSNFIGFVTSCETTRESPLKMFSVIHIKGCKPAWKLREEGEPSHRLFTCRMRFD